MTIGHAILTQGHRALLSLQLAAHAKCWAGADAVPVLVIHDGPDRDGNAAAARQAGASFRETPERLGYRAINSAVRSAILWAAATKDLDALVFHGRRWVPLYDAGASALAALSRTTLPTVGNLMRDAPRRPHMRNELFAVRPRRWLARDGALDELTRDPGHDENVMMPLHRAAAIAAGVDWRTGPVLGEWGEAIGSHRDHRPKLPTLWSIFTTPQQYAEAADALGVPGAKSLAAAFDVPGNGRLVRRDRRPSALSASLRLARFGVATLYTAEIADYGRATSDALGRYALRHGYSFDLRAATLDPTRPPAWSKPQHLLRVLADGDGPEWVWQADADVLLTDPARRLEDLADYDADVVCCEDITKTPDLLGINTGSWLVRNTMAVRRMLAESLTRRDLDQHPLWEQQAIREWMRDNPGAVRVKSIPPRLLNASPAEWRPGDFVCHFYGMPDHMRRAAVARGFPNEADAAFYDPAAARAGGFARNGE